MRIAVVIPVHNRRETTLACLEQLKNKVDAGDASLEIIVVDDGSTDGTAAAILELYSDVVILNGDGNLWWTGAINKGVEYALAQNFDYILIVNDDLLFDQKFFSELLNAARKYPTALLSSIKLDAGDKADQKIITAGFRVVGVLQEIKTLHAGEPMSPKISGLLACDLLTGASLLVPAGVFRKIGVFNEQAFPHNWGDLEFTRRASLAGFDCYSVASSLVYTDANQNYPEAYLMNATRFNYVKNLFDSTKYFYGIPAIWKKSFMHRPPMIGGILFFRGMLGTVKRLALKVFLPNAVLRAVFKDEK